RGSKGGVAVAAPPPPKPAISPAADITNRVRVLDSRPVRREAESPRVASAVVAAPPVSSPAAAVAEAKPISKPVVTAPPTAVPPVVVAPAAPPVVHAPAALAPETLTVSTPPVAKVTEPLTTKLAQVTPDRGTDAGPRTPEMPATVPSME